MLIKPETFKRLCHARGLLEATDEEPNSVRVVAEQSGLSPFHFIRQFEALFGWTPHQYRTHQRLEAAQRLLSAGHHSVTEVCMEVGFSSLGSFSELFKRRVGASPSVYSRRVYQVPRSLRLTHDCFSFMGRLPTSIFLTPRNFQEA
jgi:AraC-like DNA-binding protein